MADKNGVESIEEAVTFEDALRMAGFGKYQYFVICVGGLSLFSYIIGITDVSYALPAAECELKLTAQNKGTIQSLCFIGILCSSHLFGLISDTLGRRYLLYKCMLAHSLVAFLTSLAPNYMTFIILRFITGFLVCSATIAAYTYVGEFHTAKERAIALVVVATIGATSLIYLPITAWIILPMKWKISLAPGIVLNSWRLYLAVGGIPSVITGVLLFILPESPKFLLSRGYSDRALKVLQNMHYWNSKNSTDIFPIKHVVIDSNDVSEELEISVKSISDIGKLFWDQTVPLFKMPFLHSTLSACTIQFATFMCVNAILLWMPELFTKIGRIEELHPNYKPTLCEIVGSMPLNETESSEISFMNNNFTESAILNQSIHRDVFFSSTRNNSYSDLNYNRNTLNLTKGKNSRFFSFFHRKHKRLCAMSSDMIVPNILIGAIQVLTFCSTFLLFFLERRNVLQIFLTTAIAAIIGVVIVRYKYLVLILTGAIPIFACMACSIMTTMVVDFFPTNLRAMGMCLAMTSGKLGALVGSELAGSMLGNHCPVFFLLVIIALSGNSTGTYYAIALPVHSSSNACESLKPRVFHLPVLRRFMS